MVSVTAFEGVSAPAAAERATAWLKAHPEREFLAFQVCAVSDRYSIFLVTRERESSASYVSAASRIALGAGLVISDQHSDVIRCGEGA